MDIAPNIIIPVSSRQANSILDLLKYKWKSSTTIAIASNNKEIDIAIAMPLFYPKNIVFMIANLRIK